MFANFCLKNYEKQIKTVNKKVLKIYQKYNNIPLLMTPYNFSIQYFTEMIF